MKRMNRKRLCRALGAALLLLAAGLGLRGARQPEQVPEEAAGAPPELHARAVRTMAAAAPTDAEKRREGVYTFIVAGQDNGNGNTDTLMVVRLDTGAHRLDAVSIPRDTMINAAWKIKKINAAYSMGESSGRSGAENLAAFVAGLVGFEADSYAVMNIRAFVDAVDAMGGVWFDVPMAMHYDDPTQNLAIHLQPGYQLLNGAQAMGLCRFRSGYATADLGRIEMQQRFLKACAAQCIGQGSIPNIVRIVDILTENLETDMSSGKIAWFLMQALRCPSENISFYTAPNQVDSVDGYSYTILELDPWLEMINDCLNPYQRAITAEDLDVVYAHDGHIRCTAAARFASASLWEDGVEA